MNEAAPETFGAYCKLIDARNSATSFEDAIVSAINDIESAPLKAKVIGVGPDDVVTSSEIAKRLDVNRQAVFHWVTGARRSNSSFPKPVMKLSERSPLWRWHEVVKWLYQQNEIKDSELVENAKLIENMNVVLMERDQSIRKCRRALLKRLL